METRLTIDEYQQLPIVHAIAACDAALRQTVQHVGEVRHAVSMLQNDLLLWASGPPGTDCPMPPDAEARLHELCATATMVRAFFTGWPIVPSVPGEESSALVESQVMDSITAQLRQPGEDGDLDGGRERRCAYAQPVSAQAPTPDDAASVRTQASPATDATFRGTRWLPRPRRGDLPPGLCGCARGGRPPGGSARLVGER